ncbi:hypothetical protein [Haloarchaeobius iranensis]|uniref:DUF8048 domain-containing protein n=1 Tax=Haloarchaeobius iranensis TaxID=996166 RepID=A0A1H0AY23_9EURY|nr:hypothetical protein [Haloarchaeobius iranensis]SDN38335.1 hypothetical protein SAMN05192554_13122 [Haloarchaeobius iranensis]
MRDHPIPDEAVLLAAARAGVPHNRLPELVGLVQADLGLRVDDYRSRYECVHETSDAFVFFVEWGHWATIGERLGFDATDSHAVKRAHVEHLRRLAREADRVQEFATALEVRECVVIGKDTPQAATDGGDTSTDPEPR